MPIKKIGIPDKNLIQDKILSYCIQAINDGVIFSPGLLDGKGARWDKKANTWIKQRNDLHPVDVIILYSNTTYIPKVSRPSLIHSVYTKCKIAAKELGVHYEWLAGFNASFWGYTSLQLSVYKRKTDIGQQARDGRDVGYLLSKILLGKFFNINTDTFAEHSWKDLALNGVLLQCKLCNTICVQNDNNTFVNTPFNCGELCAQQIIE